MAGESASIHSRRPWECDVDVNVNASGIGHRKLRRMLHPGATKTDRNKKRARQRSLFSGMSVLDVRLAVRFGGSACFPVSCGPMQKTGKQAEPPKRDRKSTRLNSSHSQI